MDEAWLTLLLGAIENKFNSEDKSPKERHNQTFIARNHRDFQTHKKTFAVPGQSSPREYLTVVCDFEMTIPGIWYHRAPSFLKSPKKKGENPKCDILEILRRLSYMLRYGLLVNVPEGLEAEVNRLLPESWKDQEQLRQSREKFRSRGVSLRSCFLFTGDDDIQADDNRTDRSPDAVSLCKKAEYLKEFPKKYFYQFRKDPSDVDHLRYGELGLLLLRLLSPHRTR